MIVTDFTDQAARTKTETDVSFDELCQQIINASPVAYKQDCRWIKLARFGDRIENPESGCLRTNANMLGVSGILGDYDLEEMSIDEAADMFRAAGVEAFFYTSPSHTPEAPRWRVACPLSREHPPEAHDTFVARVNGILGGVLSNESHTRSQGYYAGRVAGVVFEWRMVAGRRLDEVGGLPEIGRSGGTATGPSGYTREAAYEDIAAGVDLHRAINHLAMLGETADAIEAAMQTSKAKETDTRRWEKRLAEIPRSIRGAQRRRERELQKHLAGVGVPPRYSADTPAPRASGFETITAASLAGKPIPPQEWLARDLIPAGQPVLLSGDGGLGKSLLALQLAVAVASGAQWLGHWTKAGSVLYLSAEDEVPELHRRLDRLTSKLEDLTALHIAPMTELDPLLVAPIDRNRLGVTALFDAVKARVEELMPALLVLDSAADYFGGNEVVRSDVRWFIGQLRKLCHATGCTVLILSHPSVSGMATGTGLSGSTHWNNSVRARLYLTRPGGKDGDRDERLLEVMKNNRGPLGKSLTLRWNAGAFVPSAGPADDMTADDVDALFLQLLGQYTEQGRYLNMGGSQNHAPSVFADDPAAKAKGLTKRAMTDAMNRLWRAKRIIKLTRRSSGHDREYIAVATP